MLVVVLQHSLIESHGYTLTISLSPLVCSVEGHTTRATSTFSRHVGDEQSVRRRSTTVMLATPR